MNKAMIVSAAFAVVLTACTSTAKKNSAKSTEATREVGGQVEQMDPLYTDEQTFAIDEAPVVEMEVFEPVQTMMPPQTVTLFFDYNSDMLTEDSKFSLIEHVSYLASSTGYRLILQGHADERGTREYNLALGYKRADSVKNYLMAQNVMPSQLESTSFGEEKLAVPAASNERDHSLNRRVELVYKPL